MASVSCMGVLLRNGSLCRFISFTRVIWPVLYKQILPQCKCSQQRQLYSCRGLLPKANYTTSLSLFKKAEASDKDDKIVKKKPTAPSRDEKTVQVFDENGLFVGKQKFWKAKADAARKKMRLVEMKNPSKSKKKGSKTGEEEETDHALDIPSYKLVTIDEFVAVVDEARKEKAKSDALRQIVIKSNVDKGGLDIKMTQVRNLLLKKGRLKVLIQSAKHGAGDSTSQQAVVSTFKKVHAELKDISLVQEISSSETKIFLIVTAKDSFKNSENMSKDDTDKSS